MNKRTLLVLIIIILLVVGAGFTTIETTTIQNDMSNFENQLTTNTGVTSSINNASFLSNIALMIQGVIDKVLNVVLSFFQKLTGMFN